MNIKTTDKIVYEIINNEKKRLNECINLIPSENFMSKAVSEALASPLSNKYSEGYPGKRYYGGNIFIDEIENLAVERAKKLFGVPHANVQPYSGSPANMAVYLALCSPGDVIMGQNLSDGGHLTHGWKVSISGKYFKSIPYHVNQEGYIDLEEVKKLAEENKPKIIWVGATAYARKLPFKEISKIAEKTDSYLIADISHIAGLIIGGVHESPVNYADIITTTTHKTLRGPRGAIIMVTEKGIKKDPMLSEKIDKAVFPGLQGGPHNNQTAAIAVALEESSKQSFKEYTEQIIKNAKTIADTLKEKNIKLVSGGTDNHMILIDLSVYGKGKGIFLQEACDIVGITLNKNAIPLEPSSPFYPSGVRLGTPAITTRGMKEKEMIIISNILVEIINEIKNYEMPEAKDERNIAIKKFREDMIKNEKIKSKKQEVLELCKKFPLEKIYGGEFGS